MASGCVKNDVKIIILTQESMHESRLTPPHVRRHFLAPVGFTEILVGYARKSASALSNKTKTNKMIILGIWTRDIRNKCNLLMTQVNKILKNLESKKLIKAIKSVAVSSLYKIYMFM